MLVEWSLFTLWIVAACLVMTHRRAGFLTNHAADLALPAWLYVIFRSTRRSSRLAWRGILTNRPPYLVAGALFVASTATEVSQYFWPHGLFHGTFDPLDIAAYGVGLAICCIADLRWPIPSRTTINERGAPSTA